MELIYAPTMTVFKSCAIFRFIYAVLMNRKIRFANQHAKQYLAQLTKAYPEITNPPLIYHIVCVII